MQCQTHLLELVAVFLLLLSHCCCLIVLLSCCVLVSLDLIHKDTLLHLIWKDALLHLIWKDISSHLLWKYILLYFIWDNILLHHSRKFLLHLYLRNICCILSKKISSCIFSGKIFVASYQERSLSIAGGDNLAELHRNRHRAILFLQILPQTEKAQSVNPQTTKYRYRRGTFKQRNHWKSKKKLGPSNITFVKFS